MLRLDSIEASYGGNQVLYGVSFEVGTGEVVALMGRNGMGKTTTVHCIVGVIKLNAGSISFDGRKLNDLVPHRIAQLGIGLVPEGRQVFPTLTVRENLVATAANYGTLARPWTLEGVFGLFPQLRERRNQLGGTLSGGEQQMLAIGRALMLSPKLLILDEATEGLAPLIREEIWSCIARLKDMGHSILLIDKNLDELGPIADRSCILEKGRVAWQGKTADLLRSDDVRLAHLAV